MSGVSHASDLNVLHALADAPPTDAVERQRIYAAAKKLMAAVEDPFDTIHRVNFSVRCPIPDSIHHRWSTFTDKASITCSP